MREYEDMTVEERADWVCEQYQRAKRQREHEAASAPPPDPELTRGPWSIGIGIFVDSLFKIALVGAAIWALVSGVRWLWEHPLF